MYNSSQSPAATVLAVDDDPEGRSALARLLRYGGYEVWEAATGDEALHLALREPDVILLDVNLPDQDGFEVCHRIKENPATLTVPVLMISGVAVRPEDRVHGLEIGADAYLTKPLVPDELLAQIRTLLRARRQARERLRQSEEQYRLLTESIPQLVWSARPDGKVEFVNRRWVEYTGLADPGPAGTYCERVIHPDDLPGVRREWERALRTGRRYQAEARLRRADGAFRWHIGRALPLRDRQGRVVKWLGTYTDIEDQKRAEEALHTEREFLRAVLDNIGEGVAACDGWGILTLFNPAARELLGTKEGPLPPEEWPHRKVLYRPDGRTPLTKEELPLYRALQGERVRNEALIAIPGAGKRHTLLVSGQAFFNARGTKLGAVVVFQDITERERLQERFLQSQKLEAVGQLAGGVAHDFNNMLTAIAGYAELLFTQLGEDAASREPIQEIIKAGERASSLTRQLLLLSRNAVLAPQVLDVNAVVTDMEKLLRRVIGEDIELAAALQPGLWPVKADPGQLQQVLLNLAVNARDAMPRGGRLTIETRNVHLDEGYTRLRPEVRPGPYVLLAVSDTGHGMTEEVRARAFEPFFTTKEPGKGTGLGLATVFGIVKQSGGHIEVYSEPGLGSTFKVYLPRDEDPRHPTNPDPGETAAPRGRETVLVVEDEPAVRDVTCRFLRDLGYAVLEAGNGQEGLATFEQYPGRIDLLVTDVVMPGMGGSQLAERFLALHPDRGVLYLSGYTDDAVVRHGVLQENVQFLQKPFSPLALAQKVREVREVLDRGGRGEG